MVYKLRVTLIYLTSSVPCCLTPWTNVFLWYSLPLSAAPPAVVSKTEMNVLVRNPEIVFVADLTRADAPALVMTTQCELVMKSGAEGSQMTAVIKDLKVHIFFLMYPWKSRVFWNNKIKNVSQHLRITYKKFVWIFVVAVGSGMSFLEREEEKQCDHSAAAVSGVLPEYSVSNLPSGNGGVHQCSHTEGKCFMIITQVMSFTCWSKDSSVCV